jgi:hypothetical protein
MLSDDWTRPQPLTTARALAPESYYRPEMRAIDQAAVFRRDWHRLAMAGRKRVPSIMGGGFAGCGCVSF